METLAEFLNDKENQKVVLEKIIEGLREKGEWGRYGIFAKIAEPIGFSQSYVSKTLKGKMPLRENFVHNMAEYLGARLGWLLGKIEWSYREECEYKNGLDKIFSELGEEEDEEEEFNKKLDIACEGGKKFRDLVNAFYRLPAEEMDQAINTLLAVKDVKIRILNDRLPDDQSDENFPNWLDED